MESFQSLYLLLPLNYGLCAHSRICLECSSGSRACRLKNRRSFRQAGRQLSSTRVSRLGANQAYECSQVSTSPAASVAG
jgi:hypothetical protein